MAGRLRAYQTVGSKRLLQLEEGDRVVWLDGNEEPLHGKVDHIYEYTSNAKVVLDNAPPKSFGDRVRNIINRTEIVPIVELIKEEHFGKSGEEEQKIEQERPKLQDIHVSPADPSKVNRLFRAGEEIQLGSVVLIDDVGEGLVKWIGTLNRHDDILIAGLEMFEPHTSCTDGSFLGKKIINNCEPDHGLFVPLVQCRLIGKTLFEQAAKQNHLLTPAGGSMHHSDGRELRSLPSETREDQQWLLDEAKRNKECHESAKQRPGQNESTVNHPRFDGSRRRFLPSGIREDQQRLLDQAKRNKECCEAAKQGSGQNETTVNQDFVGGHGRELDSRGLDGQTLLEFQKLEKETRKLLSETDRRDNYTRRNGSSVDHLFPDAATPAAEYSKHVGEMRGIETDGKSSYMEATLYSLLTFSRVLSEALERPKTGERQAEADVRRSLRSIRMCLQDGRCVSQHEMRELITRLRAVSPSGEERDPGEFLENLLEKVLHVNPFLEFSNGLSSCVFSITCGKIPGVQFPGTQQLLHQSLSEQNMKLTKAPPCLILRMPRSDDFKMYEYIYPNPKLQVHIEPKQPGGTPTEEVELECICCGSMAEMECPECDPRMDEQSQTAGGTHYCKKCSALIHTQVKRRDHHPHEMKAAADTDSFLFNLELFAVICIERVNYVTFVRCPSGKNDRWLFFNSLASHQGGTTYIPEVQDCTDEVATWLSPKKIPELKQWVIDKLGGTVRGKDSWKKVPELMRRMLCDSYLCLYQPVSQ